MKKLLAILLTLTGSSVFAAGPVYIDANIGTSTGSSYNFAGNANAGYMFNRYFGVEGGFTASNNYYLYDVAAKGVLPLGDVVDLYGKLGFGLSNYNGPNANGDIFYGAGVAFHIAPDWQLHVEDFSAASSYNPNFLMVGAQFNF